MGFEQLKTALDEGKALGPIEAKDATFVDEKLDDETALAIVLQDANIGQRYLQTKTLPSEWNTHDDVYRAFVNPRNWPNSNVPRSNLSMPLVLETIESLLPQTHLAYFSDPQPFMIDPKGRTSAEAARAMGKVANWACRTAGFEEEIRKVLKSCLLYGQGVLKWGWETKKAKKKHYRRTPGGVEIQQKEDFISQPTCEFVDLRNIIVDPSTRNHDIRTSGYRVFQKFISAYELDDLRNDPMYKNVPTRSELKRILADLGQETKDTIIGTKPLTWREYQAELQRTKTSGDPLSAPLEILEYETDDRIITVLERCIVIRNDENEEGCSHYLSCAFIDVLNSFYGFGVTKLLEGEQRLQAGVLNAYNDSLALRLNPVWHRKKGLGTRSQTITISPGKIINDDGEIAPLQMESVSAEALQAIQASEARAARRVGANFGQEMPTQAMRTAEGVQAFTSGVQVRLQYFIRNFSTQVYVPCIEQFICLCKDNLTPEQINEILSQEDGQVFQGDVMELYNGQYDIDVLSSTQLAGRRAMQAMIPLMMQMLGQPALVQLLNVQGKKFDFAEFFKEVFDISGWPATDLIVDMTPEDMQRMAMQNPAVVKAQTDQQKQQVAHKQDLEKIQAKGEAQAGVAVVRHALQEAGNMRKEDTERENMTKPLAIQGKQ